MENNPKYTIYCGIFFQKAGRQFEVVRQGSDTFVQYDLIKHREEEACL